MKDSDDPFCLWVPFPDQLQIFVAGNVSENGPFIRVPYILLGHDKGEGQFRAKGEDFVIIVVMQKQVND
ncbi:MAG: hypothetical protein DME99_05385 [Verrucomicrobia bacterium]|nr:MAG: hypothetical protein DME99_05385 [Verrucomicrobiota bacterium]